MTTGSPEEAEPTTILLYPQFLKALYDLMQGSHAKALSNKALSCSVIAMAKEGSEVKWHQHARIEAAGEVGVPQHLKMKASGCGRWC